MSQHDYVINNDSGATVRADINSVLQAVLSQNSGNSAPSSTAAGMWWLDTSGGAPYTLKIRDAGNNHWLSLGSITDPGSDSNLELSAIGASSGMVCAFAMTGVPSGWLYCDGSAVSRTSYAVLYTAIGTTWGVGDGSTTFNVPDLRGAFLRGTGTAGVSGDYVGPSLGGYQNDQNASHTHSFSATTGSAGSYSKCAGPGGGGWNSGCIVGEGRYADGGYTNYTTAANHTHSVSGTTGSSGSTEARVYNRGVQYCIKY
jgi:microcystin-dependent protein